VLSPGGADRVSGALARVSGFTKAAPDDGHRAAFRGTVNRPCIT